MWRKLALLTGLAALAVGLASHYPENNPAQTVVTVNRSPTPPWIEVYHDGELTSEWQPSDGPLYEFLSRVLEDDLYTPVPSSHGREVRPLLAALFHVPKRSSGDTILNAWRESVSEKVKLRSVKVEGVQTFVVE